MSLKERYGAAKPFADYLNEVQANEGLWRSLARRAQVPDAEVERVRALEGRWHLLVLSEDWCGDAVNTLPVLARLAEAANNLDLRVLGRDANPDLMDAHLSPTGGRAIPVVMVLDGEFIERAWWGSRPVELQRWIDTSGSDLTKEDRYREVRRWYAHDRGASVLGEVIALLERAAQRPLAA